MADYKAARVRVLAIGNRLALIWLNESVFVFLCRYSILFALVGL